MNLQELSKYLTGLQRRYREKNTRWTDEVCGVNECREKNAVKMCGECKAGLADCPVYQRKLRAGHELDKVVDLIKNEMFSHADEIIAIVNRAAAEEQERRAEI